MGNFSKDCPACKKNFTDLAEFMEHIKNNHKNIPSERIFGLGKEKTWSFRDDN